MKNTNKIHLWLGLAMVPLAILLTTSLVYSHCEIPCGIYNDDMRFDMMAEEMKTIEKSMKEIKSITESSNVDYNQLVRWVDNKERHADALCDIVTQYFLKQRIKPQDKSNPKAYDDYVHKLILLHKIMIESMKCKQSVDLGHVNILRQTLEEFKNAYQKPASPSH